QSAFTQAISGTAPVGSTSSATHNGQFSVDTQAGTIAVNTGLTVNKDDVLNLAEQGQDLVISGSTKGIEDGQHVTVEFNGHKYGDAGSGAPIEVHGNQWTLTVPHADLVGIKDGASLEITPSVSDAAGNPATVTDGHLTTDLHADAGISINSINGGNPINQKDAKGNIHVSGTVGGDASVGDHVSIEINGHTHNNVLVEKGNVFNLDVDGREFTTDSKGHAVTSGQVKATVTGTDVAGNAFTQPANSHFSVDTDITPVTLDLTDGTDSGSSHTDNITHGDANGKLIFNLGSVDPDVEPKNGGVVVKDAAGNIITGTFSSTAGSNGATQWTFHTDTTALPDGQHTLHTEVKDAHGNTAIGTPIDVTVNTSASVTITIDPITQDNVIDTSEAGGKVLVSGKVTGDFTDGDTVTLTVNNHKVTGVVDASGHYKIPVAGSDLKTDTLVIAKIDTTDAAGNTASSTTKHPYTVDLDPTTSDSTLALYEHHSPSSTAPYTMTLPDFGSPQDEDLAHAHIVIESLPNNGHLELNGKAVKANTELSVADIKDGHVQFVPDSQVAKADMTGHIGFHIKDAKGHESSSHHLSVSLHAHASQPVFNLQTHSIKPTASGGAKPATHTRSYAVDLSAHGYDNDGSETHTLSLEAHDDMHLYTAKGAEISVVGSGSHKHWDLSGLNQTELKNLHIKIPDSYTGDLVLTARLETKEAQGEETHTTSMDVTLQTPPTATDGHFSTNEDTSHTLTVTDFGTYHDADGSNAADTGYVVIDELPAGGQLQLNGHTVTLHQAIDRGDISSGALKFVPLSNSDENVSLKYHVRDNANNDDSTQHTLKIEVDSVADKPTLSVDLGDVTYHAKSKGSSAYTEHELKITSALTDTDSSEKLSVQVDTKGLPLNTELWQSGQKVDAKNGHWDLDTSHLDDVTLHVPTSGGITSAFDLTVRATSREKHNDHNGVNTTHNELTSVHVPKLQVLHLEGGLGHHTDKDAIHTQHVPLTGVPAELAQGGTATPDNIGHQGELKFVNGQWEYQITDEHSIHGNQERFTVTPPSGTKGEPTTVIVAVDGYTDEKTATPPAPKAIPDQDKGLKGDYYGYNDHIGGKIGDVPDDADHPTAHNDRYVGDKVEPYIPNWYKHDDDAKYGNIANLDEVEHVIADRKGNPDATFVANQLDYKLEEGDHFKGAKTANSAGQGGLGNTDLNHLHDKNHQDLKQGVYVKAGDHVDAHGDATQVAMLDFLDGPLGQNTDSHTLIAHSNGGHEADGPDSHRTSGFGSTTDAIIKLSGVLAVAESGEYDLKVTSDDGFVLFIDGMQVGKVDSVHSARADDFHFHLDAGQHQIQILYWDASIDAVLKVQMRKHGDTDFPVLGEDPTDKIAIFQHEQAAQKQGERVFYSYQNGVWEIQQPVHKDGTEHGDHISGLAGIDVIDAKGGDDTVYAGEGHDIVNGGAGNDELFGEGGEDTLRGGVGDDQLDGGSSSDTFVWRDGDTGHDTVKDFEVKWTEDVVVGTKTNGNKIHSEIVHPGDVLDMRGMVSSKNELVASFDGHNNLVITHGSGAHLTSITLEGVTAQSVLHHSGKASDVLSQLFTNDQILIGTPPQNDVVGQTTPQSASDEPEDIPTVTITAPEQSDVPDDVPTVTIAAPEQHDVATTSNPYLDMVQAHATQQTHQHQDVPAAASPAPVASHVQGASVSDGASHYLNMVGVDAKEVKVEHKKHGDDHLHTQKHFAHNPLADDFQDPNHGQHHGHDAFANPLEDKHDHKGDKHHDTKPHDLTETGSHNGNHNAHDQMDNHLVDPTTHHHNS
ncbi:hypothetical protein VEZ01S_28_00010, partial [Vibrio ezurae NBRC 102218]